MNARHFQGVFQQYDDLMNGHAVHDAVVSIRAYLLRLLLGGHQHSQRFSFERDPSNWAIPRPYGCPSLGSDTLMPSALTFENSYRADKSAETVSNWSMPNQE